jgi:hypothetical protein
MAAFHRHFSQALTSECVLRVKDYHPMVVKNVNDFTFVQQSITIPNQIGIWASTQNESCIILYNIQERAMGVVQLFENTQPVASKQQFVHNGTNGLIAETGTVVCRNQIELIKSCGTQQLQYVQYDIDHGVVVNKLLKEHWVRIHEMCGPLCPTHQLADRWGQYGCAVRSACAMGLHFSALHHGPA